MNNEAYQSTSMEYCSVLVPFAGHPYHKHALILDLIKQRKEKEIKVIIWSFTYQQPWRSVCANYCAGMPTCLRF